jgi:hypothetical protein
MKQLSIYLILFTLLVSCTKEVNVDLKNAPSRIVIEANVTNTAFAEVSISNSVPFSNSNTYPEVSGALVSITDNLGTKYILSETKRGKYVSSTLTGVPGRTYSLTVLTEGRRYNAVSTMPMQVNLDTLRTEKMLMGEKPVWVITPQYTDPPIVGNYYKFIETINGVRFPTVWVWDDRVINNGINTLPLVQMDSTIKLNDTIEVEMQCIDKNVFRYFTALLDVQQNMTTPANPETNISNGALGYFSAHTSVRKKLVVR